MKKIWLIAIMALVIIILISLIWFFNDSNEIKGCTEETKICPDGRAVGRTGLNCDFEYCPIEDENKLDICKVDSDCIVVNYNHCCGATKRSINKEYSIQYNNHSEWQIFNDPEICPLIGQCPQDEDITQSKCVDSRCQLVYF